MKANIFTKHRYKIHINVEDVEDKAGKDVEDKVGETTLVLFNGVAEKLLDTSTNKLVNGMSNHQKKIASEIYQLCGKEYIFKLKLTTYNLKEGLENYTVTKVYDPVEALELQHQRNKGQKVKCYTAIHILTHIALMDTLLPFPYAKHILTLMLWRHLILQGREKVDDVVEPEV